MSTVWVCSCVTFWFLDTQNSSLCNENIFYFLNTNSVWNVHGTYGKPQLVSLQSNSIHPVLLMSLITDFSGRFTFPNSPKLLLISNIYIYVHICVCAYIHTCMCICVCIYMYIFHKVVCESLQWRAKHITLPSSPFWINSNWQSSEKNIFQNKLLV